MGHLMRSEDARVIAETLVASMDLRGFRAVFAECHRSESRSREWVALFDVYSPGDHLVDGPMTIIVDAQTRTARLYPSP